jgi:hypothetical protein
MAIDQYFSLGLDHQIVSDVFIILFQSVSGLTCFLAKLYVNEDYHHKKMAGNNRAR